jgi:hypothetical protein
MLTGVAVSGDINVIKKQSETIVKYNTSQHKYSACGMQKQV